ncbi:MAG: 3D domain-containing protein [Candidatus Paceibacterales bacterium]
MKNPLKCSEFWALKISIVIIFLGILLEIPPLLKEKGFETNSGLREIPGFAIVQENTLFPSSNPANPPPKVVKKLPVVITAYSSTPGQTDDNPYITAAGSWVRDGVVANNKYPFGTKIRFPEIYGDKIFVVEDRMSWKKGNYHFDIWFPSYREALNFGAKRTYIEILEG